MTTEQAIAAEEAAVQRLGITTQGAVASQYASAQQTQAQGSFWGNIWGVVASFLPFLGFNRNGIGDTDTSIRTATRAAGPSSSSISIPIEPQDPYGSDQHLARASGGIGYV